MRTREELLARLVLILNRGRDHTGTLNSLIDILDEEAKHEPTSDWAKEYQAELKRFG